jgi:antitoxin component of MazEF toxin-antitoxin module
MGYPTKIQQITRKDFNQYYINFPRAVAKAMNFKKSDPVEWEIAGKDTLILRRKEAGSAGQEKI